MCPGSPPTQYAVCTPVWHPHSRGALYPICSARLGGWGMPAGPLFPISLFVPLIDGENLRRLTGRLSLCSLRLPNILLIQPSVLLRRAPLRTLLWWGCGLLYGVRLCMPHSVDENCTDVHAPTDHQLCCRALRLLVTTDIVLYKMLLPFPL